MNKKGRKLIGKSPRVPITFTIERDTITKFKEYCKKTGLSGSSYVNKKIEELLQENK